MAEERYTFSSLMTLLIGCESKLHQYYLNASAATSDPQLASLFADYAKSISRSVALMQRARVETVVEMALEPITSLKLAELITPIERGTELGTTEYVCTLMTVERAVSQLYLQVSQKLATMSAEIGELLMRLSRDSAERVHILEQSLKR